MFSSSLPVLLFLHDAPFKESKKLTEKTKCTLAPQNKKIKKKKLGQYRPPQQLRGLEAEQVPQRLGLLLQKGKQNLKASLFSEKLRRKQRVHTLDLGKQIYGTTGPRKALSSLALGHL